jgi:predicted transcriptional regulator
VAPSFILAVVELALPPEKEARLNELATRTGRDAGKIIEEALDRLLEDDAEFRAAVQQGFEEIDRGQFIDEEEMDARVARMLRR